MSHDGDRVDYTRPGVWDTLAVLLECEVAAHPSEQCGRVTCEPGWNWRPRLVDYDLWFVVQGHGQMRVGDRIHPVQPGTLFVLRPHDTVWAEQDPDDRLTVIYLHFDFYRHGQAVRADMDGGSLPSRHIQCADPAQIEALLGRAVRLMAQRQRLAALEAGLALQQALVEVYRQDARSQGLAVGQLDPRAGRVAELVRSHPEARLTLAEAAEIAQLSPGYFSQLFRQEIGISFRDYVVHARLERARMLLEETGMSIGQIAHALGYDDLFLFSRQFKARYGYPPSRARKRDHAIEGLFSNPA